MKFSKSTIIITVIVLAAFLTFVIKIVIELTPTYSAIKEYSYFGDAKDFISQVQMFSKKDSNAIARVTDTTGTAKKGYRYYINIELKNNGQDMQYTIACESHNEKSASVTTIDLTFAYDKINNIGGYNKKAKGINPLVDVFDVEFLKPLMNSQNINVTPM